MLRSLVGSEMCIRDSCETDFVAKNEDYIELAQSLADHALNFTDKDSFLNSDFDGMKVSDKLLEQTGVIGEKIEIGSFEYLSSEFVGSYIHAGNKIASIVGLSQKFDNASEVAKDISMQVAAMNPVALKKAVDCQRIGISVIGLEVPHVHVHLIPINKMDDMSFNSKIKLSDDEFVDIMEKIKSYL